MITSNLGFPRIGARRDLKFALERFWAGESTAEALEETARSVREANWRMQAAAGIDHIPSNDFSLYDHVLDTAIMVGAVPQRFRGLSGLSRYFAMARGIQSAPAMEMTKWFDTNYHYIVPELDARTELRFADDKPLREFREAKELGIVTRPVLLGPVSFAFLGKSLRESTIERLIPVYQEVLAALAAAGAAWVQVDEPCLGLDLDVSERGLISRAYEQLASTPSPKVLLATYFSPLRENLPLTLTLPVSGLHLDLVRGADDLRPALEYLPESMDLSLGLVDGRSVWRTGLNHAIEQLRLAVNCLGEKRIHVAPSCSLLHVPIDVEEEHELDPDLRASMAFARQKLEEVTLLAHATTDMSCDIAGQFAANRRAMQKRQSSPRACNPAVRRRAVTPAMMRRASGFAERRAKQSEVTPLPLLPTTTIGSLPQTEEIRRVRSAFRAGHVTRSEYDSLVRDQVRKAIRFQEQIGIDVLVHGEFERNDMVEYFAEQLDGFAFTHNGWVQSYGSRCVKPPVLFGDISRRKPMSVALSAFAQSLTPSPVKGMLTGPVTMLQWSFVRDDIPRTEVCRQLALALRDEVDDLQQAGIRIIQVDEPALREGLPLRSADRADYLQWAVASFRLATGIARDTTQIHTHMCYSEFAEILSAIREMDADVISIEAARSSMALLSDLSPASYVNDIGPGICDTHSPRVPEAGEIERALRKALKVFCPEQLWVNPDCGLKTRTWAQVRPMLANMVAAARRIRRDLRRPVAGHAVAAGVRPNAVY